MPAGWPNVPRKCGLLHSYTLLKAKPLGTWPEVNVVSCPADRLSSPFLSFQVQHNELASWVLAA